MKPRNKKLLLGIGILACLILVLGAMFWKRVVSTFYIPFSNYGGGGAAYIRGSIPIDSQESSLIIIGVVKDVGVPISRGMPNLVDRQFFQNINVDVNEVLKGGTSMKSVKVVTDVDQSPDGTFTPEVSFKPGEKVLLFLGEDSTGNYGVFVGAGGKFLIDENNEVSGMFVYKMPMSDMKAEVSDAMKAPPIIVHNTTPVPYSGEVSPK